MSHHPQPSNHSSSSGSYAPTSPSKRWHTTTHDALSDAADRMGGIDRKIMVDDLRNRKLANTKTSINFGNEEVSHQCILHRTIVLISEVYVY